MVTIDTIPPAVKAGIRGRGAKRTTLESREVARRLALHGSLVVVLEVSAHTREVDDYWDVKFLEFSGRADAAELENLGRVLKEKKQVSTFLEYES